MNKLTADQLARFEKAIKAWICPECYKKDDSMVKCYNKDRRDLMVVLNNLKKGNFEKAYNKLYWLDTIVRELVPCDVYDYVIDKEWEKVDDGVEA